MALIKRNNAQQAAKDAIVLDLSDLGRQAEKLKKDAEQKAQQIVDEAEQRAQELTEGAEQRGYDAGYQRGYDAGFEAGQEAGRAEALQQAADQLQQLQQAWTAALQQWEQDSADMQRQARQQVLELAACIAEKVVHRQVALDSSVVIDQLEHALSHVMRPLEVVVYVHPDDRPVVEEAVPRLVEQIGNVTHVQLVDDKHVGRGGCRVSYGQGQVDARIETQLDRLIRTLLPHRPRSQSDAEAVEQQSLTDNHESAPTGEGAGEAVSMEAAAEEGLGGDEQPSAAEEPSPTAREVEADSSGNEEV